MASLDESSALIITSVCLWVSKAPATSCTASFVLAATNAMTGLLPFGVLSARLQPSIANPSSKINWRVGGRILNFMGHSSQLFVDRLFLRFHDTNLLGVVDFDSRQVLHQLHFSRRATGLFQRMSGGIIDAGFLEPGGSDLGDDDGEVFPVAKIRFGVQVDFTALFEPILGCPHFHLDCDRLANLLSGVNRRKRFVARKNREYRH